LVKLTLACHLDQRFVSISRRKIKGNPDELLVDYEHCEERREGPAVPSSKGADNNSTAGRVN
ncbi:MAG TPA: hypothetical protein VGF01_21185, partial [Terracidiphilus sp.]